MTGGNRPHGNAKDPRRRNMTDVIEMIGHFCVETNIYTSAVIWSQITEISCSIQRNNQNILTRWRKRCFKSLRSDKDACRHTCNHLSKTEPAANKLGRLSALLQDFVQTPKCIAALTVFWERMREESKRGGAATNFTCRSWEHKHRRGRERGREGSVQEGKRQRRQVDGRQVKKQDLGVC